MRKAILLLGLLAVSPVGAQINPDVLAVLLSGKPQLPGGQSFRYFANETSNLKSDTAGTVAITGAGDSVGAWFDGTGNGYNVFAASNGERPTYQVRSGKPYVTGDGVNDLLTSTTAPNLYGTGGQPYTVCLAYRWTSPVGSTSAVDESDSASASSVSSHFRTVSATPADMLASMRGSDGSTNIVSGTFVTGVNNGVDHVICWVRNSTVLTPYVDGVPYATKSVTATAITLNRVNLFGRFRAAATKDSWANVDIYGTVAWKSDQTGNIGKITTVMRALMP